MKSNLWILFFLLTSACVADKNVQDYRDEYAHQQIAKVQAISGVYRGNISSVRDQKSLGAFSITLYPDTKIQTSSDGLYSEQQAIVRGTINYLGTTNANIVFDQGEYIDKRKLLKATIQVTNVAGNQTQINLTGTITGSDFSGRIEVAGFPDYGGAFTLTKDAPMPKAKNITSARVLQLSSQKQVFVATYGGTEGTQVMTATMGLAYVETTPEQFFERIFEPQHDVQASVVLDSGAASEFQILFDSAHLDERTGTLKGKSSISDSSGIKHVAELECHSSAEADVVKLWDCQITGDGNKQLVLQFKPKQ